MYDKKLKGFKERQAKLITEKQLHSDGDEEFYLSANMVLNVASRAAEIIKSSEPEEKRKFFSFLLQNCTANGKTLSFSLREPFDRILATADQPIVQRTVNNVRTIIQRQSEYIYIPDLSSQGQI